MKIRRENYGAAVAQSLIAALGTELLERYQGFDGSGRGAFAERFRAA